MPTIVPPEALSLRQACDLFAVPDSTLRGIIRREGISTLTERRLAGDGRTREMVVLPPESLRHIGEILAPFSTDAQPRAVREADGEVHADSVGASAAPVGEGSETEARQARRIADLELQIQQLAAQLRAQSNCIPADHAPMPPRRIVAVEMRLYWPSIARRFIAAARSPAAIRAIFAARVVCTAIIWILYPEWVAVRLSPPRPSALRTASISARANTLRRSA